MKFDLISSAILSVLLITFHWIATRLLNITLKPFVKLMMRLCMPRFVHRFLMQY